MDWQDRKFDEVFENVCSGLEWRAKNDPSFNKRSLEESLRSLYSHQGNNWDGRGEVAEITLSATIAAFEHVLAEFDAMTASGSN
jgi:hypothetical protein